MFGESEISQPDSGEATLAGPCISGTAWAIVTLEYNPDEEYPPEETMSDQDTDGRCVCQEVELALMRTP